MKSLLLIITLPVLCMTVSCKYSPKANCDLPVPDLTIARIIEKIIFEDTLTISGELFSMYAQKKHIKEQRIGLPGPEVFIDMQLEKLRFYNDSAAFVIIRKLYPYLSTEDSVYIRCQINSDSTTKAIRGNLLSLKNLNEVDNYALNYLSVEDRYEKYHAYYTFSKPYFFNHNKLCFVDVRWHCGVSCGDFWLVLLSYRDGEWSVINRLRYGVS